jgi:hypothetical protein
MTEGDERGGSLLPITVRRSITLGRLYLGIGTAYALILAIVLARAHGSAFETAYPLEVPIFASLGSLGALMVFTADRTKGVFEYLIAYGARPAALFANAVAAAVILGCLVLAGALVVGLGTFLASGGTIRFSLEKLLVLYTLPMTFAATVFTTTAGMYWSTLSSPRAGMNSPIGLSPLLGIGPTLLVLVVAETSPAADFYTITGGATALLGGVAILLVALSGRLMRRERFLSQL